MRHKLYYRPSINTGYEIEILENDIVKIDDEGDELYRVVYIQDSDLNPMTFYCCAIINAACTKGYDNIFGGKLIFVDREFYDPDHF